MPTRSPSQPPPKFLGLHTHAYTHTLDQRYPTENIMLRHLPLPRIAHTLRCPCCYEPTAHCNISRIGEVRFDRMLRSMLQLLRN